jgi:hypothetical protein
MGNWSPGMLSNLEGARLINSVASRQRKAAEDSRTAKPGGNRGVRKSASALWRAAVHCRLHVKPVRLGIADEEEDENEKGLLGLLTPIDAFARFNLVNSFNPPM